MTSNSGFGSSIEKLVGRENFTTWQFAIKMEHEELWDCVLGTEKDEKKIVKAKSKIILLIDPVNNVHIQEAATVKDVWDKLKLTFKDSGLTSKVGLLRSLITMNLENCISVEDYVNNIISTAHKLTSIGFKISDEWIGTLLLAGLPDEYKPMIMGIESSGIAITGDSIKIKLLQDVKVIKANNESAFYSNKNSYNKNKDRGFKGKNIRCYKCNQYGHKANECPERRTVQTRSDNRQEHVGFCAGFAAGTLNQKDWFIDSGASTHMTMHEDWLYDISESEIKEIVVADNF